MKLNRKQLRKMIIKEMMGPKSPSDYLKPHLKKHAKYGTDPDTISSPYDQHGNVVGTSDYDGSYEDYKNNINSPMFSDHLDQFNTEDGDSSIEVEDQFVGRAIEDLEDEGNLVDMADAGSEGYQFQRGLSDEELGLVDDEGTSQLYERKMLRKMILQELSKLKR